MPNRELCRCPRIPGPKTQMARVSDSRLEFSVKDTVRLKSEGLGIFDSGLLRGSWGLVTKAISKVSILITN